MNINIVFQIYSLIANAFGCNFLIDLISNTQKSFFIEIEFPNRTKSELFHVTKNREIKQLRVIDECCNCEPTIVNTYTDTGNGKGQQRWTTSSILDGIGILNYGVNDDLQPRMQMRVGVACGFGECGRG
uniref:Uncharacterized protein n=1 Tax=Ascaris lumbricoides TaxID=6252 RepID=A0A0M3HN02_ASCLU